MEPEMTAREFIQQPGRTRGDRKGGSSVPMVTAPEDKQQVVLPATVIDAIRTISRDENLNPGARLTSTLMLVYGWAWYERQKEVDPRALAIPEKQWLEVCGLLTNGVALDPIAGVNLGLSWMNSGPSSY